MRVVVRLGRLFSKEAGFSERAFELGKGANVEDLLREIGKAAPGLSCVDEKTGAVDLAMANLSVSGQAVNPLEPQKRALHTGDAVYLYSPISGG